MNVQTSITYEELARRLGLARDLSIELVEVHRVTGRVSLVVSGDLPSRTVTGGGFYPSPKHPGSEPDYVHLRHLTAPDTP